MYLLQSSIQESCHIIWREKLSSREDFLRLWHIAEDLFDECVIVDDHLHGSPAQRLGWGVNQGQQGWDIFIEFLEGVIIDEGLQVMDNETQLGPGIGGNVLKME